MDQTFSEESRTMSTEPHFIPIYCPHDIFLLRLLATPEATVTPEWLTEQLPTEWLRAIRMQKCPDCRAAGGGAV